jgi:hypothetical protein
MHHPPTDENRDAARLVLCTVQSQYVDVIDDIFAEHEIVDFIRHPRAEGSDRDGRHRGSKVFPGTLASFIAYVPVQHLEPVLHALRAFRDAREAHAHLRAAVLVTDRVL